MSRTKLLWIGAALIGTVGLADGAVQMRRAHTAAHPVAARAHCPTHALAVDLDGDGTAELVRLERVGDEAWADVWSGTSLRSTTRVGAWHDDAELEALDVNGDGRIDLVRRFSVGPEQHAEIWLADDGLAFAEGWSGITANTCLAQR